MFESCLCNKIYKKIDEKDISFLNEMLGCERVFTGDNISEDFCHDELNTVRAYPEVLVDVLNTEEISKIMKYAYEKDIPVVVRGSGTGLVGRCV